MANTLHIKNVLPSIYCRSLIRVTFFPHRQEGLLPPLLSALHAKGILTDDLTVPGEAGNHQKKYMGVARFTMMVSCFPNSLPDKYRHFCYFLFLYIFANQILSERHQNLFGYSSTGCPFSILLCLFLLFFVCYRLPGCNALHRRLDIILVPWSLPSFLLSASKISV